MITYTYIIRPKGKPPVTTPAHEDLGKLLRAAIRLAKALIDDPIELAAELGKIKDAINGIRDHVAEIQRQRTKQMEPYEPQVAGSRLGYGETAKIPGRNMNVPASKDYAYQKYRKALRKQQLMEQQNEL